MIKKVFRILNCFLCMWLVMLGGCAVGIRAEGCDVLLVEWEGIIKADALPVEPEKPP